METPLENWNDFKVWYGIVIKKLHQKNNQFQLNSDFVKTIDFGWVQGVHAKKRESMAQPTTDLGFSRASVSYWKQTKYMSSVH